MLLPFERSLTYCDTRESIIKKVKHVMPGASHNSSPGETHMQNLEEEEIAGDQEGIDVWQILNEVEVPLVI